MRFDRRLEGAEEISHADVCGMSFKAKGTPETKAQACNVSGVAWTEREKRWGERKQGKLIMCSLLG